jgi:HEAT repeat protein
MTHRHILVLAGIIALPAMVAAQTPKKPVEPIGAPKIKYHDQLIDLKGHLDLAQHMSKIDMNYIHDLDLAQQIKGKLDLNYIKDLDLAQHMSKIDMNYIHDLDLAQQIKGKLDYIPSRDALLPLKGYADLGPMQGLEPYRLHDMEVPRQLTWYQEDPADSLYRAAYNRFTRQEYRLAAQGLSTVRTRFPNTRYFCDAAYFEAFSRYRLGTPDDLRTGYRVLESMSGRCSNAIRSASADMPQLKARIDGALARLGDADAAKRVRDAASQGQSVCDSDERAVKIEALNTLAQMDPATANPVLRTVLASKDPCSGPVRQQAISLVARRNDSESVAILLQIAKTDTDQNVQRAAVSALSRMTNDASVAAMEDLLRNSTDERTQYEAAAAMARSEHPRAQAAVRALIERRDVAERIRLSAINALTGKENLSLEYWRTLYTRVESDQLRVAIISAIGRINTDEAHAFLLSIARNPQESSDARRAAISRIQQTAPISELYKLLETADSRSQRHSIVSAISSRKEPEATDRLIDIAKTSTDPDIRNAALRALTQGTRKNDPKVMKALAEIISGDQP